MSHYFEVSLKQKGCRDQGSWLTLKASMKKPYLNAVKVLALLTIVSLSGGVVFADALPPLPEASLKTDPLSFEGTQWDFQGEEDGIKTWRSQVEGSPLVAWKGEALIDAPIGKVASVLADTSRKTEWIHKAAKAENVRLISPLERIEYNRTETPPLIMKDRDFVFHAWTELDRPKKEARIFFLSVEDPLKPEDPNYVRGKLIKSRYVLTQEEGGAKTRVIVEIHLDPMGSVPKWLVNLFQKSWPFRTLSGIRKQVAKADVFENKTVKAFFDGTLKAPPVVTAMDLRTGKVKVD